MNAGLLALLIILRQERTVISHWKESRDCVSEVLRESSHQINIDISVSHELCDISLAFAVILKIIYNFYLALISNQIR